VLCLHNQDHSKQFEKAILKAHELDEISGSLESYPPIAVGKSLDGVVFVNNQKKATGNIEISASEIDFKGASPSLKLKYKDVAAISSEQCAVIVNKITLPANVFDKTITPNCCLEVNTSSGSKIDVCLVHSKEYECEAEVRKLGSRIR